MVQLVRGVLSLDPNHVRGTMNTILYGINFVRELTEVDVERLARIILEDNRRERFREAIAIVLADRRLPAQTLQFSQPHTEAELLDLLARVSAVVDERSPSGTGRSAEAP